MHRNQSGFSLVELTVATAILALVVTVAVPALLGLTRGLRLRLAAAEITGALREARMFALRHQEKVAVKFRTDDDGSVRFALYRDGDGDGVRNDDIASGKDPLAAPARTLAHLGRDARFGFPRGLAPCDPSDESRRLERLDDPIRFNRSDLASFSPLGSSTPGSIYLTDGESRLLAVRVDSRAGRPHVLVWDRAHDHWR